MDVSMSDSEASRSGGGSGSGFLLLSSGKYLEERMMSPCLESGDFCGSLASGLTLSGAKEAGYRLWYFEDVSSGTIVHFGAPLISDESVGVTAESNPEIQCKDADALALEESSRLPTYAPTKRLSHEWEDGGFPASEQDRKKLRVTAEPEEFYYFDESAAARTDSNLSKHLAVAPLADVF